MKTRNLLFALALPAAFAACSQDEFATEESGVSLAGRKSIGEITLVTDAQTRFSIGGNGFEFNNEDALSAALIDRPYSGVSAWHDYAHDNYAITDYISSNYKFEYKGGNWSSKAAMVEGNYIFLAPYVNHSVRKPMEAVLPAEQNLKLDASGKIDQKSAIQEVLDGKNPVFIAHRFLAADGGTEQGINFYSIYSYPIITVKNTDALRKEVIVKKVLLKNKKGFMLNAPFSNEKVRNALLNEVFAPKGEDTKDQALMGAWAKVESHNFGVKANYDGANKEKGQDLPTTLELTTVNIEGASTESEKTTWYNGLAGKTTDLLVDEEDAKMIKGEYIVINFPGNGYKLKYGESVSFNAVVPADEYTMNNATGDLELYVVVNTSVEGTTVDKVWQKDVKSRSQQLTLFPGKSYPYQDYNGASLRSNKGGYFTILTGTEADGDVAPSKEYNGTFMSVGAVTTTEELRAAIAGIQSNTEQVIIVNGKNVKFNKAVNEAVANTACQKITIQGLVYFDASDYADKKMVVSDRIAFEEAVIEKGEIVFSGAEDKDEANNTLGDVIVMPKATLNISKLERKSKTILNYGKLKLAFADAAEHIYNHGELEIAADMRNATISNLYKACTDDKRYHGVHNMGKDLMLSLPVNLTPSVHVLAGGKYAVEGDINYQITVDKATKTKAAGELILKNDAKIVKDEDGHMGNIINSGNIVDWTEDSVKSKLTVGRGVTMTNNAGANIDIAVSISGPSHSLEYFEKESFEAVEKKNYDSNYATVINGGTMYYVALGGKLVMNDANARVTTIKESSNEKVVGQIDNTKKGILPDLKEMERIVVFATYPSIDATSEEKLAATIADMKTYMGEVKQVKEFRLTGALTVGDTWGTGQNIELNLETEGITINFVKGSSLNIGEATFETDATVKVSYPDVKWTGRTDKVSLFSISKAVKGVYGTTVKDGKVIPLEGNVDFDDCQEVEALALEEAAK